MGLGRLMLAVLLGSGVAHAVPLPNGGANSEDVAGVLRAGGLTAEVKTDRDGDPVVFSKIGETRFAVFFYDCRAGRCGAIQFSSAFSSAQAVAKVAEWNRTRRFGRAYVAPDGSAFVEMDVELAQGGSTEGIGANLARWRAVLTEFGSFVR